MSGPGVWRAREQAMEAAVSAVCAFGILAACALGAAMWLCRGCRPEAPGYPPPVCETCGRPLDGSTTNCVPEGEP
jgi:predicted amidophosphoribosyltransferase